MEQLCLCILYINKQKYGEKRFLSNKTLIELREELEKEISNNISFMKKEKSIYIYIGRRNS